MGKVQYEEATVTVSVEGNNSFRCASGVFDGPAHVRLYVICLGGESSELPLVR